MLARKYRYFPLASNAGEIASAIASVTCVAFPVAVEYRKIERRWLSSAFEYVTHFESGDHTASNPRLGAA